jgi:glycosyltransferase involved in cell wall biosynthesis
MKKIAIIKKSLAPEWQSCKTISDNLLKAYELLRGEFELTFHTMPKDYSVVGFTKLMNQVKTEKPDQIIWPEYSPPPLSFARCLERAYKDEKVKPQVRFHIYGDFVLNIADWVSCSEVFKKMPVQFIAASDKQKQLLEKFVIGSDNLVSLCPFPVDSATFYFDSNLRKKKRDELGILDDEILVLYSGRLSFQKNIYHMLLTLKEFLKVSPTKLRFFLAGPIDDLGVPYLGGGGDPLCVFFGHYLKVQKGLGSFFSDGTFKNIGNQSQESLHGLYCASDVLLNLSTHNDEDYGMAPAEALASGCPAILSNWGGFYSFKKMMGKFVKLVGVKKEQGRFLPTYSSGIKEFLNFSVATEEERKEISELANSKFGIVSASKTLDAILKESSYFEGYTDDAYKLSTAFQNTLSGPFKAHSGSFNESYFKIYTDYGGEK